MSKAVINFYINKFWKEGAFWISVVICVIAVALYNNPTPSAGVIKIYESVAPAYTVGGEPMVSRISIDWLNDRNKCIALLYPSITECGLGVVQYNNKTYATFIIRKSEVSQWDSRYMKGVGYYFKYYPVGTDNVDIDLNVYKPNQTMEDQLFNNIDSLRDYKGFNLISTNKELTYKARVHSASMALQGKAFTYGVDSPYYMVLWCE